MGLKTKGGASAWSVDLPLVAEAQGKVVECTLLGGDDEAEDEAEAVDENEEDFDLGLLWSIALKFEEGEGKEIASSSTSSSL